MAEKKSSDEAGYYIGWYVAYGLFACFAIYFFWQVKSVEFCVEADKHCFRDWVSALGGWAALFAAIPTVAFLYRQVKDGRKHHIDLIMLAHGDRMILAEAVEPMMQTIHQVTHKQLIKMNDPNEIFDLILIRKWLTDLLPIFESEGLREFEKTFHFRTDHGAAEVCEMIRNFTEAEDHAAAESMRAIFNVLRIYSLGAGSECRRYLSVLSSLTSPG